MLNVPVTITLSVMWWCIIIGLLMIPILYANWKRCEAKRLKIFTENCGLHDNVFICKEAILHLKRKALKLIISEKKGSDINGKKYY